MAMIAARRVVLSAVSDPELKLLRLLLLPLQLLLLAAAELLPPSLMTAGMDAAIGADMGPLTVSLLWFEV
jgi:hypothetical protein